MIRLPQTAFVIAFLLASLIGPACDTGCAFEQSSPLSTADAGVTGGCCDPSSPDSGGHPMKHDSRNDCNAKNSPSLTAVLARGFDLSLNPAAALPNSQAGTTIAIRLEVLGVFAASSMGMVLPDLERIPLPLRV
jgi:hypothetical protein